MGARRGGYSAEYEPIALLAMVVLSVGLYLLFKRRKWL
jgi:LPXTG-motif cell wall-anchored protein